MSHHVTYERYSPAPLSPGTSAVLSTRPRRMIDDTNRNKKNGVDAQQQRHIFSYKTKANTPPIRKRASRASQSLTSRLSLVLLILASYALGVRASVEGNWNGDAMSVKDLPLETHLVLDTGFYPDHRELARRQDSESPTETRSTSASKTSNGAKASATESDQVDLTFENPIPFDSAVLSTNMTGACGYFLAQTIKDRTYKNCLPLSGLIQVCI